MIKKQLALLLTGMMTTLAWAQDSVVKVEGGLLQGIPSSASEITVFKGIPYAAPPVGELRWKRPQPVVKWDGVKVADTFSNICWQPGNAVIQSRCRITVSLRATIEENYFHAYNLLCRA